MGPCGSGVRSRRGAAPVAPPGPPTPAPPATPPAVVDADVGSEEDDEEDEGVVDEDEEEEPVAGCVLAGVRGVEDPDSMPPPRTDGPRC